jgi:hypothetical protein
VEGKETSLSVWKTKKDGTKAKESLPEKSYQELKKDQNQLLN